MKQRRASSRGFSIMELLAVLAIIAILAALLFPVIAKAKDSGTNTTAMAQAKQLGLGMMAYVEQHDGRLLPSTNYGAAESSGSRIWPPSLMPLIKSEKIFVAPGSEGKYASSWDLRGWQTIGYNSSTAIDKAHGCKDGDPKADDKCQAFRTALSFDKSDTPAFVCLFAVTPGGDVANKYLGYEFNPYNGTPNPEKPQLGPPLASDRDLVKELAPILPAENIKAIHCRYLSTGSDDGVSPLIFGDGHARSFSAKKISSPATGIVWRLR